MSEPTTNRISTKALFKRKIPPQPRRSDGKFQPGPAKPGLFQRGGPGGPGRPSLRDESAQVSAQQAFARAMREQIRKRKLAPERMGEIWPRERASTPVWVRSSSIRS
jgi:hypothetical protein